jgi:hypothetical protein
MNKRKLRIDLASRTLIGFVVRWIHDSARPTRRERRTKERE